MHRIRTTGARTFSALGIRNYRLWFVGQGISLSGTWMQTVAQGLLVLQLTGSGTTLGFVTALQALPVLLLGPWGGVVADRFPKRRLLYATQATSGALALTLGGLVAAGAIRLWMIYLLALALGLVKTIDNPTRQAFVLEMVGKDALVNAVSLNSTQVNLARVIGPTFAGVLIATVGLAACFIVDGLSYLAVLAVLVAMRASELRPTPLAPRAAGQLQEGFRYVRSSPIISTTLLMMAIIGLFTYEFSVSLPLFAEHTFGGGPSVYAAMTAAMGLGAVIGGLYTASRPPAQPMRLSYAALFFGCTVLVTAFAPSLLVALILLVAVGFWSIGFTSLGNATIQLESAAAMRGRVMALWTVAFLGSTPIGGPLIGFIGEHAGPREALAVGGIAALVAAFLGARVFRDAIPKPARERPLVVTEEHAAD
ncbi:MAG: MFS transporter [Thermomicrobiales bacterium]|nr:MFS transporter [Thermomicrobiales bacterium]